VGRFAKGPCGGRSSAGLRHGQSLHRRQQVLVESGRPLDGLGGVVDEDVQGQLRIEQVVRELLAPVLNSPTLPQAASVSSSSPETPIDLMVKRQGKATYLFAVGMRNGAALGAFTVHGLPKTARAEVIGEARTITIKGGKFSDAFGPYAVHLYQISQ